MICWNTIGPSSQPPPKWFVPRLLKDNWTITVDTSGQGAQEWQEKQKRKSTAKVGFIRTSQEPPPRLWQDTDHNGASEAGELHTLVDLGVTTISLDYREARRRDRYGNRFPYRAKVAGPNGGDLGSWAYDVFLVMLP